LDAVFRGLAYKLSGITNGIDTSVWNPATDPHLPANYTADDLSGKKICKRALQKELGLGTDDRPLVGIISRLVDQKGIDLAIDAVRPELAAGRMQLAVLGSGDSNLEWRLKELQNSFPGAVCFWVGYNEALAHRIEAGSDLFLMPSRYEPCGLNQMYSLRYGTLPLVRYTGGLADRVTDICSGHGNGFTFGPVDSGHLRAVLDRALAHHFMFRYEWDQIVAHAMRQDFCWSEVAGEYLDLYRKLCVV
jgi:starch synthase